MASYKAEIRKAVLQKLKEPLADQGFKLRGTMFERVSETDLSQQIFLGLDRYWGIRSEHIALGFVLTAREWVYNLHPYTPERNWRSASASEIRDLFTDLVAHDDSNVWFPLSLGIEALSAVLLSRIQNIIIPHLDRLRTRKEIVSMWREYGQAVGLPPRHELSIAILMYLNDWEPEGRAMLERLGRENEDNEFYQTTIRTVLEQRPLHSNTVS